MHVYLFLDMHALLFTDSHIPKTLGISMWFPNVTVPFLSWDVELYEIILDLP